MTVIRDHAVIESDYHQFSIEAGSPRELVHGEYPEFPLAIFAEDMISVKVGIKAGPVNVATEVHDAPPEYDDSWEDSVEGDLIQRLGQSARVTSFWDTGSDVEGWQHPGLHGLTPPGERRYRVRIYARGKDSYFDGYHDGDPIEDYLIQMWPTEAAAPPAQTKHTSGR